VTIGQVAALATLARCPSLLSSPTGDTGSSEWEHALSATNSAEVVTADLSRATSDSHPPAAVLDGEIDSSDQHSEKASPEMSPLIDIHRKRIFDPSVTARFMPNYINANRLTQTDLVSCLGVIVSLENNAHTDYFSPRNHSIRNTWMTSGR